MADIALSYYGPFDDLGGDRIYASLDFRHMFYVYEGGTTGMVNWDYTTSGLNITFNNFDFISSGCFATVRNQTITLTASSTYYLCAYTDYTNREVLLKAETTVPSGYTTFATIVTSASDISSITINKPYYPGCNITTDAIKTVSSEPTASYTGQLWIPKDVRS